ncbi:MAG: hypothetical protein HUU37_11445, partial [Bdellovibrionales bacterium]|nr:hypothetical protein [Bdellovibrionales bacterium]
EIGHLREQLSILDEIFAGLLGLDIGTDLGMIRRHLEPEEIHMADLRISAIQARESGAPTALLQ